MKPIENKEQQVTYLKERLEIFLEVLEAIDPETTELEDIDRLIEMIDDLSNKMDQFQAREKNNIKLYKGCVQEQLSDSSFFIVIL